MTSRFGPQRVFKAEEWAVLNRRERGVMWVALVLIVAMFVVVVVMVGVVADVGGTPAKVWGGIFGFTGAVLYFVVSRLVLRSARSRADLPATHGGPDGGEQPGE